MRIARYTREGRESFGFVLDDAVVDHADVPGLEATSVREVIANGGPAPADLEGLPTTPLAELRLLPPVELAKVLCAGVNFPTHREEASQSPDRPEYPVIFSRFPNSHVGHGEDILKPAFSEKFDYEGELGVVIGKRAWRVKAEDALDYVFGYVPYNDGSVRDWQRHTPQWIPGKNFYQSGGIGPWITTADEVPEIGDEWLETRVNGEVRQRAQIKDMVFSIAELIEYLSSFTPLEPGDIIAAGTPGGVGLFMDPPGFLVAGDVVEVEVSNIGVLRNAVAE